MTAPDNRASDRYEIHHVRVRALHYLENIPSKSLPELRAVNAPYSSSKILLAKGPTIGTSYLSSVSASRYAFSTNHPINTKSPSEITQLKKVLHENNKCRINTAVNSRLDCHAWNLT